MRFFIHPSLIIKLCSGLFLSKYLKSIFYAIFLFFFITLLSCGSKPDNMSREVMPMTMMAPPESDQKNAPDAANEIQNDRKIIKDGNIRFETTDVNDTKIHITGVVEELQGYIENDNAYDYKDRLEHNLVIRIPARNFDQLLAKISKSIEMLESRNISVLDVTEEFIDTEARLKTKKELENRYRELLKKATTVKEILEIEREIGILRADIESVEGRLNYFKDRIAFSKLTVTYYQQTSAAFGFGSKFKDSIRGGWTGFQFFILALFYMWPFIILVVILFISIRWYLKNKSKNKSELKKP